MEIEFFLKVIGVYDYDVVTHVHYHSDIDVGRSSWSGRRCVCDYVSRIFWRINSRLRFN